MTGKTSRPKAAAPRKTTGKAAAPKAAASKSATSKAAGPKASGPKAAASEGAAPKAAAGKSAAPKTPSPKAATPKTATSKTAKAKAATAKAATAKAATGKAAPKARASAAGPVATELPGLFPAPIVAPNPDRSSSYPDPVFVLAAPRSFSSLVNAMIGQHPELYGMPELNLFQCELIEEFNSGITPAGTKKSPVWASMRHGLLRAVAEIYSGEQTPESIRMAERWLKNREMMTSGEVFVELAEAVAPRRIVEKSPGVLRMRSYLDRMLATFPNARFIHLLRHPVPQGQSVFKAKGGVGVLMAINSIDMRGPVAVLEPQIAWYNAQIQILRFLDDLPEEQFITIKGEAFLNDLDNYLPELCRWLGISDDPAAIDAMRHPELSPYSCEGPANATLGNDINFLKSPALREGEISVPPLDRPLPWRKDGEALHPEVQALARTFGY